MRRDRELSLDEMNAFGSELDALRQRTLADLGEVDARYIRRIRAAVRFCCWSGRGLLMLGWFPPTWLLGTLLLGLGKILENMELGHNVMHGQYDWMNDPEFAGRSYEWDIAGPSDFWRHTHNHVHHTWTNVLGMDDDVGYGVVRLFPEQRWKPFYRWQPLWVTIQALLFQYAVAIQHLRLDKWYKGRISGAEELRVKETDRIAAMATELRKLGANINETQDGMVISPSSLSAASLVTHHDHRLAMAFGLLSRGLPGLVIQNPEVVSKSWPDYFDALKTFYF